MSLELDLNGKRALVSGVSSGIGAGIAKMLARAGCDVSGCGLDSFDSAGAQQFIESVAAAGRKAEYVSLDLRNPGDIERWVESAVNTLGGIDILISNAGMNTFEGAECSDSAFENGMDVNLTAHWRLAKAAHPYLKQVGTGVIVIITSNHAHYTMPGCFPYNVAKSALLGLVQSLAIEWGPRVRAAGIAPGYVDTPALHTLLSHAPDPEDELAKIYALHPVNRMGSVEDIGALCAFLASEWGGFISGTTLLVDGGRSALMQDDVSYV